MTSTDDQFGEARTPREIRSAVQELLKHGLIEADRKPNLYRTAFNHQESVINILEPLDLTLQLDEERGLLFVTLRPVEDDELRPDHEETDGDDTHPLIRRQRFTLEQSLLVAVLRQHYIDHEQSAGVGGGDARIAVDDLTVTMQSYLPETGSETQNTKRVLTLLQQLQKHNLVTDVDENERLGIRPLIRHVANPDSLNALLEHFRAAAYPQELDR